jgi:predicted aspartyl protease
VLRRILTAALCGLALIAGPAASDTCQLKQFASVPVEYATNGHVLLNVAIDNEPVKLVLDTGAWTSSLGKRYVARRDLPVRDVGVVGYGLTGKGLRGVTQVGQLKLGDGVSRDPSFGIAEIGGDGADGGVVGLFGADYLASYEVEFDPSAGLLKLFLPEHCAGKVVYWASEYFRLPLQLTHDRRLMAEVSVEGRTLRALIDTGAPHTTMRLAIARSSFDVTLPDGPTAKVVGVEGVKVATFPHTFESLTFGGITLRNTQVLISDIDTGKGATKPGSHITGMPDQEDLIIGMSLLRQLHFLIAYSEPALYFTVGDPPKR